MVSFLSTVRPTPSSMTCFAPCRRPISLYSSQLSLPRSGFFPFKRILQACLQSNLATAENTVQIPAQQSDIIFMGTGTSEGIPRVSCLTNPSRKCLVWMSFTIGQTMYSRPFQLMLQCDFEVMKKTHYYLVDTSGIIPGAAVSELQFNIINEDPFHCT